MTWKNEPLRHSLASQGVETTTQGVKEIRELDVGKDVGLKEELEYELKASKYIKNVHAERFKNEIEILFNIKSAGDIPSSIVYELETGDLSAVFRFPKTDKPKIKAEKIEEMLDVYADWVWIHEGEGRRFVPHVEVVYENVDHRHVDDIVSDMNDWVEKVMDSDIYG